jgi:hypothetical protein
MKHSHHSHMWLCGGSAALTVVLVVAGAGAWAFIPAAGCAVACAMMIWTMVRDHRPSRAI